MRTISLWEPWASAIAKGLKKIETRSWDTQYRGVIAIHASKTTLHAGFIGEPCVSALFAGVGIQEEKDLSFGCVVAVARLVNVLPVEQALESRLVGETEAYFGNYTDGRYAWMLEDVKPLLKPLQWRGSQGFFDVPEHLLLNRMDAENLAPRE